MTASQARRMQTVWTQLGRGALILVALGLSALLGWVTPTPQFSSGLAVEMVLALFAFIAIVVVALRHLELGVYAIVLAAFFIRVTIPTGTQSRIPVSLVLTVMLFGFWMLRMLLQKHVTFVPSRINMPLLGFVVVALFSYPWSWLSWRPELWQFTTIQRFMVTQIGGLSVMVLLPAAFFLGLNVLTDVKWPKWLLGAMVVIALPELVARLTGYVGFAIAGIGVSGPGLYHQWLIALLYAQLLFNPSLSKLMKVAFAGLIAGWFFWGFVIKIEWISGWGPSMLAIWFLTFLRSKRAAFALVILAVLVVAVRWDYFVDKVWHQSAGEDFNRFWIWQTIIFDLTLSKAGIVLGAGPAGYAPYFMTYYPGMAMSAHNNFVDIIAETGLIGTFFFMWFLGAVLYTGWTLKSKIKDHFLLAYNNGLLAGFVAMLAAMMLDDWFLPFAYNNGLPGFDMNVYAWLMLGTMAGLERWVDARATTAEPVRQTGPAQVLQGAGGGL